MGNIGVRIFPLTLTLSLKGEGTDSAQLLVSVPVFSLSLKGEGTDGAQLLVPAPVFSLSLWERAGVRASARTFHRRPN